MHRTVFFFPYMADPSLAPLHAPKTSIWADQPAYSGQDRPIAAVLESDEDIWSKFYSLITITTYNSNIKERWK